MILTWNRRAVAEFLSSIRAIPQKGSRSVVQRVSNWVDNLYIISMIENGALSKPRIILSSPRASSPRKDNCSSSSGIRENVSPADGLDHAQHGIRAGFSGFWSFVDILPRRFGMRAIFSAVAPQSNRFEQLEEVRNFVQL